MPGDGTIIGGLNIGKGFNVGKVGECGDGKDKVYVVELKDIGILKFKEQQTDYSISKQPRIDTIDNGDTTNSKGEKLATIGLFDLNDCNLEVNNDLNKTRYSQGIGIFGNTTKNVTVNTSQNKSEDLIIANDIKAGELKVIMDKNDKYKAFNYKQ